MINKIIKFLILGAVIWFAADYFPDIHVAGYQSAIIAAVVLALVNMFVKPLVKLIAMPITFFTLGLFSLVITVGMIFLVDYLVDGFTVASLLGALILSVLVSVANSILDMVLG